MKNIIKINSKYFEKLGLDIKVNELPDGACIKRINFDSNFESDIDMVRPHIDGRDKEGRFSKG